MASKEVTVSVDIKRDESTMPIIFKMMAGKLASLLLELGFRSPTDTATDFITDEQMSWVGVIDADLWTEALQGEVEERVQSHFPEDAGYQPQITIG